MAVGPNRPEKQMSSRLMNMKFMQRLGSKIKPLSSTKEKESSERPTKRQKTVVGHSDTRPQKPQIVPTTTLGDQRAAEAIEEANHLRTLERIAFDAGDEKWMLASPSHTSKPTSILVSKASYSEIDTRPETILERDYDLYTSGQTGRARYGNFGLSASSKESHRGSQEDSAETGSDSDDGDDVSERSGRRPQQTEGKHTSIRSRDDTTRQADSNETPLNMTDSPPGKGRKRKRKHDELARLTSISSGGAPTSISSGGSQKQKGACFICGSRAHQKINCPKAS